MKRNSPNVSGFSGVHCAIPCGILNDWIKVKAVVTLISHEKKDFPMINVQVSLPDLLMKQYIHEMSNIGIRC